MSPTTTTSRRYRALLDLLPHSQRIHGISLIGGAEDWKIAHNNALTGPRENEWGIRDLILGWLTYADQHETQFGYTETVCKHCGKVIEDYDRWTDPEADGDDSVWRETCDGTITEGHELEERHGGKIGDDYVLGDAWGKIGQQLLTLLNGDLGRLDGSTLNSCIHAAFRLAGLDENGE